MSKSDESDDALFRAAVEGATPLADRRRARLREQPERPSGGRRRPFTVERRGLRVEGRSHGVSRKQLQGVRTGTVRPEATLDLHRMRGADAARALEHFIDDAVAAGLGCVLVIHGRGLHSAAGPVLIDRVIKVLSTGRVATHVRAFCSASGRDGGDGAMYVLVKHA